ncbi:cell wall elongation regulator TseB-like domain-containing protein [Streptococcus cuniculipharyngis]|uniref:Peptidase n=1 Tax=Streptococcus cuniculipharyngis TaxID=1562651 RepID=A0A5C5SGG5_9STRE|nr:DUF5590 domain-containing protein [Streptococcus cuniculipharyngis]TWS99045.1 peptidase [Streptococcus cuniculipharyngis]
MKDLFLLKQYLLGLALLAFSLLFGLFIIGYLSLKPHLSARQEAEAVARNYAQLTSVAEVDRYSGEKVYYTVYGQDPAGQALLVSVNQADGQVIITPQDKGISKEIAQVKAQENGATAIRKTVFGLYQGQAIWEVTSGKAYYLIDFVTGNLVKKEGI